MVHRLLIALASLVAEIGSRCSGCSGFSTQAQHLPSEGSKHRLGSCGSGLVALWFEESPQTWVGTLTSRWILIH